MDHPQIKQDLADRAFRPMKFVKSEVPDGEEICAEVRNFLDFESPGGMGWDRGPSLPA